MFETNLTTQTPVSTSPGEQGTALKRPRTILVCEDDDGVRELLVEALQDEGFSVCAARNGREALALLGSGNTGYIVLLDLMMPDISGYEMLELMAADPQFPGEHIVIVLSATGFIRPVSPSIIQKHLVHGFLRKPFELDELLIMLREFT